MNNDALQNLETKPDGQPAGTAKPAKAAKPKKEKKLKPPAGVPLPFLLEFTYTVSALILIFLALAIIVTSIFAGASLYVIVLRTSVAVVVVGVLLYLVSSQISSGLLFAVKIEREEAGKKLEEESEEKPEQKPLKTIFTEEQNQAEAS